MVSISELRMRCFPKKVIKTRSNWLTRDRTYVMVDVIKECIRRANRPLRQNEIKIELYKASSRYVGKLLKEAVRQGLIVQTGAGVPRDPYFYSLPVGE